jgi:hypothetical protein
MIVLPADRCTCHEWVPTVQIGDWPHNVFLVRERAAHPEIWEPGYCKLSRQELRDSVIAAGRVIRCEHALKAWTRDGHVELTDGVHRWAIAVELGIDVLPVLIADATDSPMYTCL